MLRARSIHHQLISVGNPAISRVFVKSILPRIPLGTLLYVHGLGESSLCFESLVTDPRLASWKQILPDLPGYGRSEWLEEPLALAQFSEAVAAIAGEAATPPVILVGHSMGGVIGQLCMERWPERFDGFVNIEGNLSLQDCMFSSKAAATDESRFVQRSWDNLREWVFELGIAEPAARSYFASLMFADPRAFHLNGRELIEYSSREDLAERFSGLPMPGVYVAGLNGGAGHRSLQLLESSGANLVGVSDAGHWPFLDRREVFLGHLTEFLDSVREHAHR